MLFPLATRPASEALGSVREDNEREQAHNKLPNPGNHSLPWILAEAIG